MKKLHVRNRVEVALFAARRSPAGHPERAA
jgi:hypothetical protein